jgi:hypothetical protein
MVDENEQLAIVVGEDERNQIVFALDRVSGAFLAGPISVRQDGEWIRLAERNGIEALALANLRDDIRDLVAQGGMLYFGDHDYEQMVTIEARDGVFLASVELPSEDRWEIPIQHVTYGGLQRIVEVVDEAEARFGALTEHCGCGLPQRHWRPISR